MKRTFFAPAKINLWLRVFAPDDSGYHPLDTLFCAIDLRDQLDVRDGDGLNAGIYRFLLKEKNLTGIDIVTPNNLRAIAQRAYSEGRPLPISMRISPSRTMNPR